MAALLASTLTSRPALGQSAAPEDVPIAVTARYHKGQALFEEGRYADAARQFEKLYWGRHVEGRSPAVALAVAQCRRLMGDFPSALYYYQRASVAYEQLATPDAADWRAVIAGNLGVVIRNLSVVALEVPRAAPDAGDGAEALPAPRLCSLRVDGKPPLRYSASEGERLYQATAAGPASRLLPRLQAALAAGGLGAASLPPQALNGATLCHERDVEVVVDRTQDHHLQYVWQRDGQSDVRGSVDVRKRDLAHGRARISIAKQPATVSFQLLDTRGRRLHDVSPRAFRAFLRPMGGGHELPMLSQQNVVLPQLYALSVDVSGYRERNVPETLALLPGEARTVPVEIDPWFYREGWFWIVLSGLALGVAAVGVAAYVQKANEPKQTEQPKGNLEWTVTLP